MHIFLSVRLFCTLSFEATVLSFQRKSQRAETKRKTKATCTLRVPEYCCPKRRPAPKLEVRPVALPPWRKAPGRQGRRFCEPQNNGLSFRSKILKEKGTCQTQETRSQKVWLRLPPGALAIRTSSTALGCYVGCPVLFVHNRRRQRIRRPLAGYGERRGETE